MKKITDRAAALYALDPIRASNGFAVLPFFRRCRIPMTAISESSASWTSGLNPLRVAISPFSCAASTSMKRLSGSSTSSAGTSGSASTASTEKPGPVGSSRSTRSRSAPARASLGFDAGVVILAAHVDHVSGSTEEVTGQLARVTLAATHTIAVDLPNFSRPATSVSSPSGKRPATPSAVARSEPAKRARRRCARTLPTS